MTANELATINYRGTDIYVHDEFVAVRQMAESMGLDWEGQRQLIERSPWSEGHTFKSQACLPGSQQAYNTLFMHRRRVPMWVANISTGHIKDEAVKATVIRWQNEIADVLADYYEGKQPELTGTANVGAVLEAHAAQLHRVGFHPDGTVRYVEFKRTPALAPAPLTQAVFNSMVRNAVEGIVAADTAANAANESDMKRPYANDPYRPLLIEDLRRWTRL